MTKSSWNELPRLIPERGYHGLATVDGEMFLVGGVTTSRAEGREGTTEMLDAGQFLLKFYHILKFLNFSRAISVVRETRQRFVNRSSQLLPLKP